MTGWAHATLRIRDAAVPRLMAVVGPMGAIGAVAALSMRQALGMPPQLGYLFAAVIALVIGIVMVWARWRLRRGNGAVTEMGILATLHALAGALALRAVLGPNGAPVAAAGFVAVYAPMMAALLAWCARVPIGAARDPGSA
ncbi:hypothetical protein M1105_08500 [Limibaculum sp. FT325]|uniref:hypothetical protein n=1 Tax=Thermohalobaculum sediminis TaxID=2939436 RepID=UPI0020BD59FA|nr:hypothetical protein [Limibaculum sediminis]MCL5777022.1 hypothetical protein [Limibaculum sediminis]